MSVKYRPISEADYEWVVSQMTEQWGSELVVAHGQAYYPGRLPGFVAVQDGQSVGLVTYHIKAESCEIVTLHSLQPGQGIGTRLVEHAKQAARHAGCRRLWLITTNDNLTALRFYQKRGFHLVAVHPGAVNESREIKPSISEIGLDGIPIRDELVLELDLSAA
jgi:ribosomal protein S18 acetylase RimI-like enzyme